MACADRAVEGVDSSGGGAQTEVSTTSATSDAGSGTGSSSTSTSSDPAPKYDLGASTKLDVAGPEVPPFSCDVPPPARALLPCGPFEAPWGHALVQCVAAPTSGCVPPDDAELPASFETCGQCGGSLIEGPCGPVLSVEGACCYWGAFEDGYCPTG